MESSFQLTLEERRLQSCLHVLFVMTNLISVASEKPWLSALAVGGVVAAAGVTLVRALSNPKWQKVGTLDQLWLYPLKSGKGIPVYSAELQKMGMTAGIFQDRQFCVVSST